MSNKTADWAIIEADYRAGVKSLRAIAREHGLTEGAIRKRAKKETWTRDLSGKIRAQAEAMVRREAVRAEVRARVPTDDEIVEANAEMQAGIIKSHRADIQQARSLSIRLLQELQHHTDYRELYEKLGDLMSMPDDKGVDRLNELYRKAMALPSRTGTMKQLADTIKTLVSLEREAFGIDGVKSPGRTLDEFLAGLSEPPNP